MTRRREVLMLLGAALLAAAPSVTAAGGGRTPLREEPEEKVQTTAVVAPQALPSIGGTWVSQGPGPILNGQTEGITSGHVIGAIQTIVAHPTNADIVWIGTVNGGVWKTTNATNASPTWTASGDAFTSLSIGAMGLDPTDGTHNTLVAAGGRFSSFSSVGGPRGVLFRTTDGGTNWTAINPATLAGKNVSGIAARGTTIVVSINNADSFTCSNLGIFRSTDTGSSFSIVSGTGALPQGRAFDLATDPSNSAILYTAIRLSGCTGTAGIYRSADTGATWTRVSSSAMDTLLADAAGPSNTRIAVGASGQVYVAITGNTGQLAGLFRSPASPGTGTWTQLDTPKTNEGGTDVGMHPREKSGGQGGIHLSIVADPTDANIVYLGGDRQPIGVPSFPNSIGAQNFSGRLFRVNASAGTGAQSTPLTHCQTATAACNSTTSTSSNSSPHADSRRMVFNANGDILESDDGGIFRRTNPRTTGDWFSLNGNLRVTEIHDVSYDGVSNMIIGGNQDNGTSEQTAVDGISWSAVSSGDGGDVAVDDFTSGTQSTRYSSFQNLGSLRRRIMNTSGAATSSVLPALTVTGGGPALVGQFATPIAVNGVDGTRFLIAGFNDLYESLDRGDTITALGFSNGVAEPTTTQNDVNAMVFGGRSGGIDNVNLIYAICSTGPTVGGANVFVRTAGSGAPVETVDPPGATALRDIAVDPDDWQTAFVVDSSGKVFTTTNTGANWTEITGNLASGSTDLRSILFIPGSPDAIVVGGLNGVFRMAMNDVGVWQQFGAGLSNAPVWDLDYDAADDTLVAGTMGRGAWKLNPAGNLGPIPTLSISDVTVTEGNAGTTNATFTVTLSASSGVPVTVNYSTAYGTAHSGPLTVTNSSSVSIAPFGNASPYPATVAVSGLTGTITKVVATLTGFFHTYRQDVDVLLVGPGGQSVVLMSDAGGTGSVSGNFTFDDDAAGFIANSSPTGTYKPTNINDNDGADAYSSPAPASGYGSTLSVFNATAPNGTWSLYVVDDVNFDGGSISSFSLVITTTTAVGTADFVAQSGQLTFAPTVTSQPITILVNGDTDVEASETFAVNLSTPGNATILDGQGLGTITDDDGVAVAAPTNVVATATAPTSVNITWTASAGATSYRVYRKSSIGGSFSLVGSPVPNSFDDPTASSGTAYFYMVRAFNGSESGDSNTDLATTGVFTDPTLTSATLVKLAHFDELLTAVNAMRTFAGASTIAFTAPAPTTSVTVRAQHVLDLRAGLDDIRSTLGLSALTYTDPSLTAGTTTIKSAHITELRNGVL